MLKRLFSLIMATFLLVPSSVLTIIAEEGNGTGETTVETTSSEEETEANKENDTEETEPDGTSLAEEEADEPVIVDEVPDVLAEELDIVPVNEKEITKTNEELLQNNSLAMLNYITVLTQEINSSKNNRLYLEDVYSSIINDIYPNSIDSRTLSQFKELLKDIEAFRMIDVQRDRIDYLYQQNQAKALRAAVPNPLGLLSDSI